MQGRIRSPDTPFHLAIIGSGPAAFYTAYTVMKRLPQAIVDMYESLPVPFGLVRYGVAPDHPEVKNCQRKFEEIASSKNFRFLGNISVGRSISTTNQCSMRLRSLMRHYDSVLLAYGASEDRTLGLSGESTLKGIYSARQFVGWYNGLPACADLDPVISSAENAIIIGQGNVALDVARILLEDIDKLRKTDIAEHALEQLSQSRIKRVHIVGRRGPVQAAFTVKEIRELMRLSNTAFHPVERSLIPSSLKSMPRTSKRLLEVILNGSEGVVGMTPKSWSLDNCLSPVRFLGEKDSSVIASTVFEVMKLNDAFDPSSGIVATGETVSLPSQAVFRSVGYKSTALSDFAQVGIHFDKTRDTVATDDLGRVMCNTTVAEGHIPRHNPGLYCTGWAKNGPTGVLASTMQDAFVTGEAIARDWTSGAAFLNADIATSVRAWDGAKEEVQPCADLVVCWEDWLKIDKAEKANGAIRGKEREKFTNVTDMLTIIR